MTPITAFNRLLTCGPQCPQCGKGICKHLYIPHPVPIAPQPILWRAGERSGSPPRLPGLFQALKESPGPSELAKVMKPLSHKEKVERLIELIAEKRTPRLKGRIKVELVSASFNYRVRRNGKAILIQTSVLPNDKRFLEILVKFSSAARRLISARPFDIPAPKMTPDEHRGWEGLLGLGARVSRGGTALDLRSIRPQSCEETARFLHLWQLVCSGPCNVAIKNRDGDPIGVYTKERLS